MDLMEAGERVFNLMRMYVVREGVNREMDHYPEGFYKDTSLEGGEPFDRDEIDAALDRYYDMRGWTRDGVPTPETLARLGLEP